MNLQTLLSSIFGNPSLPIEPDAHEQEVLAKYFPPLSGKFLEALPRPLVIIQLKIAAEKAVIEHYNADQLRAAEKVTLHTLLQEARKTGEVNKEFFRERDGSGGRFSLTTASDIRRINEARTNIFVMQQLFELLNRNHRLHMSSRGEPGDVIEIQYDNIRRCLVYSNLGARRHRLDLVIRGQKDVTADLPQDEFMDTGPRGPIESRPAVTVDRSTLAEGEEAALQRRGLLLTGIAERGQ